MLDETTDGGEAAIARGSRVSTMRFDMFEEGEYSIGLDVIQIQIRHGLTRLLGQKQKE
jgi:hypothetical protein